MVGKPKIVANSNFYACLVSFFSKEWEMIFHHYWESSGGLSTIIAVVCDDARQNNWAEFVFCVSNALDGFRALFHDGQVVKQILTIDCSA